MRGSCLCGQVGFEVEGEVTPIGHCHCSKCRKVSGTGSNAVFRAPADKASVRFRRGEAAIKRYRTHTGWSSVFCGVCGSPVPHSNRDGSMWFVPAGSLDEDPGVRPAVHIFVGSKAAWEQIHDGLPQFEEDLRSRRLDGG